MNWKGMVAFLLVLFLCSCKKDETLLLVEQQKEAKKQEAVFAVVNANWNFNAEPINSTASELNTSWSEWRLFLTELAQKPRTSIGAFKQKAKMISKRAAELQNTIPIAYNKPEIRSRIATLITKTNALELYLSLKQIKDDKIVLLIPEINKELHSLQNQLGEIDAKSRIKMEDGEEDMIRMLDTSRAIQVNEPPKEPVLKDMTLKKKKTSTLIPNR